MSATQRVFLIDDHPVVRSGLALLLDTMSGYALVGEAGSAAEARARLAAARPAELFRKFRRRRRRDLRGPPAAWSDLSRDAAARRLTRAG